MHLVRWKSAKCDPFNFSLPEPVIKRGNGKCPIVLFNIIYRLELSITMCDYQYHKTCCSLANHFHGALTLI
jgi:hypothetical protein